MDVLLAGLMYNSRLETAHFIRRYKRFFADVQLNNGEIVTAHCPNTGRMTGCIGENWPVRISRSDNPKRKLAWTLEQSCNPEGTWIGLNTGKTNAIVRAGIEQGLFSELSDCQWVRNEPGFVLDNGHKGRFDLAFKKANSQAVMIEVKSVTLVDEGIARFPDAVSLRAKKHMQALSAWQQKTNGQAILCFCVQRSDANKVCCASEIDPEYCLAVSQALEMGVKIIAAECAVNEKGIRLSKVLPFEIM